MRAGTASEITAKIPGERMAPMNAFTSCPAIANPIAGDSAIVARQMADPMAENPSSVIARPGSLVMSFCITMAPTNNPTICTGSVMAKITPRPAELTL
jgi:hypothetical protein